MWWPILRSSRRLLKTTFAAIPISGYGCIADGRPGRRERKGCTKDVRRSSEPIAAVFNPPTRDEDWNRSSQCPVERQDDVRNQAQYRKQTPENLLFHSSILGSLPAQNELAEGHGPPDTSGWLQGTFFAIFAFFAVTISKRVNRIGRKVRKDAKPQRAIQKVDCLPFPLANV